MHSAPTLASERLAKPIKSEHEGPTNHDSLIKTIIKTFKEIRLPRIKCARARVMCVCIEIGEGTKTKP